MKTLDAAIEGGTVLATNDIDFAVENAVKIPSAGNSGDSILISLPSSSVNLPIRQMCNAFPDFGLAGTITAQ